MIREQRVDEMLAFRQNSCSARAIAYVRLPAPEHRPYRRGVFMMELMEANRTGCQL